MIKYAINNFLPFGLALYTITADNIRYGIIYTFSQFILLRPIVPFYLKPVFYVKTQLGFISPYIEHGLMFCLISNAQDIGKLFICAFQHIAIWRIEVV